MQLKTLCLALCTSAMAYAQNPGDSVFTDNQVLEIQLQFPQESFWDSLVANYETETYMMANLTVTDLYGTHTFDSVGVRLKGNSSYGHPGNKKSFKIDFNRYVDGQEYDGLRKLNFNNCFKDPSFMREKIYYDICRDADINAPRCNYANVYMNGTLWGFYSMVEQIDDEWLKTHFDQKNENLFKAGDAFGGGPGGGGPPASADLMYYGTDTASYTERYTLENNTDENDWGDLIRLTEFINESDDATFADELSTHFHVPHLMRSMAMYNLFANLDSYANSARNYYIYDYDSTGYWEWINWDCNEAFGLYSAGGAVTDMTMLDPYYYTMSRPLLERIVTIDATQSIYDYYYCELYNAYFKTNYVDSLINEIDALIQDDVYADPNKMYTNAQYDTNLDADVTAGGGPGGGTIYGLRSFVTERVAYLDGVIDCSNVQSGISDAEQAPLAIYPNPTSDYLYIDMDLSTAEYYTIMDLTGSLVRSGAVQQVIEVAELPSGYYVLSVIGPEIKHSLPFMIKH